jgi:uncharacterized coiled-coil DUF342 family protein
VTPLEAYEKQLADLKETMLNGFKSIEKQITDLTLEVKAHNKAIAEQDKAIALANSDIKSLNNKIEEVSSKTDKNHDDIIKIKTDADATRRTYNWLIGLVSFFLAALNFMLRFGGK